MRRTLQFIDERFEEIIGVAMLATCLTLIFIGVVMRLTIRSGIPWQEELSRILYVLVVYVGASYGMKSEDHIRITFIRDMLPPVWQKGLEFATDVIWLGFNLTIVVISFQVYPKLQRFIGESAILEIPLHYIFLTVPLGCLLISLRLAQQYVRKYSSRRPETEA
jgi:C4-dicarboxylate transporter, DctQ subunit